MMKKINLKEIPWKEVIGLGLTVAMAIGGAIADYKKERKFEQMEKFFDSMQSKSEGS